MPGNRRVSARKTFARQELGNRHKTQKVGDTAGTTAEAKIRAGTNQKENESSTGKVQWNSGIYRKLP